MKVDWRTQRQASRQKSWSAHPFGHLSAGRHAVSDGYNGEVLWTARAHRVNQAVGLFIPAPGVAHKLLPVEMQVHTGHGAEPY